MLGGLRFKAMNNKIIHGIIGGIVAIIVFGTWRYLFIYRYESVSNWYFLSINYPVFALADLFNIMDELFIICVSLIYWFIIGFVIVFILSVGVHRVWDRPVRE